MRSKSQGRPSFRPNPFKKKKQYTTNHLYGDDWQDKATYVKKRDNYRCRAGDIGLPRCNNVFPPPFTALLHAHHVVPLPRGSNATNNLVTLCKNCHSLVHGGKNFGKSITQKQINAANKFR